MTRWQSEREHRAFVDLGLHGELDVEQRHDALHDAQAQSVSLTLAARSFDLVELLIDVAELVARNADTGIDDLDTYRQWRLAQTSQRHRALTRVFDGVRDQVLQDLLYQGPVAVNRVIARCHLEEQALVIGQGRELEPQLLEECAHREVAGIGFDGPGLELADVEQRIEQARHRPDRLLLLREYLRRFGLEHQPPQVAVQERQRLERLAQIVTGRRQEAALALIGPICRLARRDELGFSA